MYHQGKISVFLSHSHKDLEKVRKIRDILETLNCEPITFFLKCLDDDNAELEEFIMREIEARNVFIYCKSANAERSEWVQKELQHIRSFDSSRLYTVDLSEDFEIGLVSVLSAIIKLIHNNTIFLWCNHGNENLAKVIGVALARNGFSIRYFTPNIGQEKPWNLIETWEWPMLHDRYSIYIEEMVSKHISNGVFVPILSNDFSDNGWDSFVSSKIYSTIEKNTNACIFPLFVDGVDADSPFRNINGMIIRADHIDAQLPEIVRRINIIVKA